MKEYALILAGSWVGKGITRLTIEADVKTGRAKAPPIQTFTFWWSVGAPIAVGLLEYFRPVAGNLKYFLLGLASQASTNLFDYAEEYLSPAPFLSPTEATEARKAIKEVVVEQPSKPFKEPFVRS